jgi:hypothetical protein
VRGCSLWRRKETGGRGREGEKQGEREGEKQGEREGEETVARKRRG